MVVYGPTHVAYDLDLGPIMMHDYFRKDYQALIENTVGNDVGLQRSWMDASLIGVLAPYCSTYAVRQHTDRRWLEQILCARRKDISL